MLTVSLAVSLQHPGSSCLAFNMAFLRHQLGTCIRLDTVKRYNCYGFVVLYIATVHKLLVLLLLGSVMVSPSCQLTGVLNYLGDTALGVSVRCSRQEWVMSSSKQPGHKEIHRKSRVTCWAFTSFKANVSVSCGCHLPLTSYSNFLGLPTQVSTSDTPDC